MATPSLNIESQPIIHSNIQQDQPAASIGSFQTRLIRIIGKLNPEQTIDISLGTLSLIAGIFLVHQSTYNHPKGGVIFGSKVIDPVLGGTGAGFGIFGLSLFVLAFVRMRFTHWTK